MTEKNRYGPLKSFLLEEELFSRKWTPYQIIGKQTSEEHPDVQIADFNVVVLAYHRKDVEEYVAKLMDKHKSQRISFTPEVRKLSFNFKDCGLAELLLQGGEI